MLFTIAPPETELQSKEGDFYTVFFSFSFLPMLLPAQTDDRSSTYFRQSGISVRNETHTMDQSSFFENV